MITISESGFPTEISTPLWTLFSDICLARVAPVLIVFMAGRLFRDDYRGGKFDAVLAVVRNDEDRIEEKEMPRSATWSP